MGWVLDRIENVWRTIGSESSGRRAPEFGEWWKAQKHQSNRIAINTLRNAEVKRGEQSTARTRIYCVPGTLRVNEDGTMQFFDGAGNEVPAQSAQSLVLPAAELQESRWEFAVDGLEGRTVAEVLNTVLSRLESETIPTAERLLFGE